eukprot:Tbor_TRINITY_DN5913_c1_g1::TRINITY_DN5913_c1_g1_i14::g.18457::m.18457
MEKKEEKIEEIKKQDEIEKRNKKLIMGSIKNNQIFNTRETKEIKENNLDKKRSPGKGRKRIGGEILDALADDKMDELFKLLEINAFHSLLSKTKGQEIAKLKIGERKFAALHFNFHWIGSCFLRTEKKHVKVTIFDSAPHPAM